MVSNQVLADGVIRYIKSEVLPVLPGYAKLVAGAALIHNASRMTEVINMLTNGSTMKTLGIVEGNGEIDVDVWSQDLKRSMDEFCGGRIEIQLPALSPIIFTTSDIDTLKRYLKGEL